MRYISSMIRFLPFFALILFACSETQSPAAQQNLLPDISIGRADAPVTIIEYASMTCGHCAQFHNQTYPLLKKDYIDPGKVRLIFREFPLDPWATAASMLARCVARGQSKSRFDTKRFLIFLDILFQQQARWALAEDRMGALKSLARQAGLGEKSFIACFDDKKLLDGLHASRTRGSEMGVEATPSFFINGVLVSGNQPYPTFRRVIDEALDEAVK